MTEDRPTTDGGETAAPIDVERAGTDPPDPPTENGMERELPTLLGDADHVSTAYLVRAGLADGSGRPVGERLVEALEDKVTVVGSSLEAGFDPANPELDVLIETDHDHGAIASSLASVGPVDGVVVADVSAAVERELEDEADEVDEADANDVFNELKEEVGQEGYGTVVDELEDVSFPGGPDPDEEVDLEAEVGVELSDDDPEPIDLDGDGTIDLEDDGGLGLDGADEITTKQLLGEEERDDTAEVKAPDEKAIEEAIEEVELDPGTNKGSGDTVGAESADPSGESGGQPADESPTSSDGSEAAAGQSGGRADQSGAAVDPVGGSVQGTPGAGPADEDGQGSSEDAPVPPGSRTTGEMGAFVADFVDALETGAIDEEQRTELREALGIESTHSLDVRMEYLQKRVDNLAAYTDAWEAFLSEQGSGRDFMESVRDDLEAIEDRLVDVEEGPGGDPGDVEARLGELERRLSDLATRQDDDVARLDTRMDSVESKLVQRIDAVEDGLTALKEKVSTLLQWREHIDDVLGDGAR